MLFQFVGAVMCGISTYIHLSTYVHTNIHWNIQPCIQRYDGVVAVAVYYLRLSTGLAISVRSWYVLPLLLFLLLFLLLKLFGTSLPPLRIFFPYFRIKKITLLPVAVNIFWGIVVVVCKTHLFIFYISHKLFFICFFNFLPIHNKASYTLFYAPPLTPQNFIPLHCQS